MTEPERDFRYTLGDVEIEAYQITPRSRWQDQLWPDWLKKKRLNDDKNCVFTLSDNPDVLWLALPDGDVELPYLAWVVKHANGNLGYMEAMLMEAYTKVVPVPTPVVHAPADGIPDLASVTALKPVVNEESLKNISGDTTELRNEMLSAIKMLQEADADPDAHIPEKVDEALTYLKACMAARTIWCKCPPSLCARKAEEGADIDIASCRQNSPLVN